MYVRLDATRNDKCEGRAGNSGVHGMPELASKKLEKAPLHGSDTLLYAMWAEG